MKKQRIFLIILDSFGIGYSPDAADFGDEGANTLKSIIKSENYHTPNLLRLGLSNIDTVEGLEKQENPEGTYGRLMEASRGKDTTIGHWEIAGIISPQPLPTYPRGFPAEIVDQFIQKSGREILCNQPYSGTEVIKDYGGEHLRTGKLIVYTSADSVFQIAAHEEVVPIEELYSYCQMAREILVGQHGVGRVIARPFIGTAPDFHRTANRHDYSLLPPRNTMLDALQKAGYDTFGIGKIHDIFAGQGISHTQRTSGNKDGMEKTMAMLEKDFQGLCFVNLVDFDMVYGHRNDVDGYAQAATEFDRWLGAFMEKMKPQDILMITADHGCDPGFPGTDHSRECVPFLAYGTRVKAGNNLGTRTSFADIGATILNLFGVENTTDGKSFKRELLKEE